MIAVAALSRHVILLLQFALQFGSRLEAARVPAMKHWIAILIAVLTLTGCVRDANNFKDELGPTCRSKRHSLPSISVSRKPGRWCDATERNKSHQVYGPPFLPIFNARPCSKVLRTALQVGTARYSVDKRARVDEDYASCAKVMPLMTQSTAWNAPAYALCGIEGRHRTTPRHRRRQAQAAVCSAPIETLSYPRPTACYSTIFR